MIFDSSFAAIGVKMVHVSTKWDLSWPKMAPSWLKLAQSWTKLVPNTTKLGPSSLGMRTLGDFRCPKRDLGPSQGVQGCTKEAPRRHQGGTEEAPRRGHCGVTFGNLSDMNVTLNALCSVL